MLTTGFSDHRARLQTLKEAIFPVGAVAVKAALDIPFAESQSRVPVGDTGNLAASGQNWDPVVEPPRVIGAITYGDSSTQTSKGIGYEVFVHEGHEQVAWGHSVGHQPPNKFLESSIVDSMGEMGEALAEPYRALFGGGL